MWLTSGSKLRWRVNWLYNFIAGRQTVHVDINNWYQPHLTCVSGQRRRRHCRRWLWKVFWCSTICDPTLQSSSSHYHYLPKSIRPEVHTFPSVLWHCRLDDKKGIRPVKTWVLVCWRWWYDWSFACHTAPHVTTHHLHHLYHWHGAPAIVYCDSVTLIFASIIIIIIIIIIILSSNKIQNGTACHPNCFILRLLSATTEDTSV